MSDSVRSASRNRNPPCGASKHGWRTVALASCGTQTSLGDHPMFCMYRIDRRCGSALLLLWALLLAGCGGGERKVDSQIAATVNQGEISVHQVQSVLQRQPAWVGADGGAKASARVLEGLIDQELAAQAAREASFEKDPRVVQSLEAARRELLALAWQESIAAKVAGPASDEIDRYFDAHPELFAQRKLYIVQETELQATASQLSALPDLAAQAKSPEELAAALQRADIRSSTRTLAHASEDLPQMLLNSLSKLEAGRSWAMVQGDTARVFTVLHAHRAPIERRKALDAIGAYLTKERKAQAIASAMKERRAAAKINYQGAFAMSSSGAASNPAAQ